MKPWQIVTLWKRLLPTAKYVWQMLLIPGKYSGLFNLFLPQRRVIQTLAGKSSCRTIGRNARAWAKYCQSLGTICKIKEGKQFATLTDIITKAWAGKTTKEYKVF
jgi:hypothetical protein